MNIRIVLGHKHLLYVLDRDVPPEPPREDTVAWQAWSKHHDDNIEAQCIMLAAMTPKYRRQNKAYTAAQIMVRLKDLHDVNLRNERFETTRKLFKARMQDGASVEQHVSDMIACIDRLASLNFVMDAELSIDLILHSLPDSWGNFILNYNMIPRNKTLGELLSMLKEAEPEVNKGKKKELHLTQTSKKGPKKGKKKKTPTGPSGGV